MKKPRTIRHKNVSRIDHPGRSTYGYFVRIQWKGEKRAKLFSDAVYGDRLAALDEALRWRDATEKELGKPRTDRLVMGITRSTSGIVGVRRRIINGVGYYEATWMTTANKMRRARYSVERHGERKALAMARKVREQGERLRLVTPHDPE
ncbi:MAG: hypothetical protein H7Y32_03545 [Chloroflexales bacterium]|nr:hypothetical protein [Chloroflexales bacterium]